MRMPRLGATQASGFVLLVLLISISAAVAWYATSRDSSASQHFNSCRTTSDGRVALRYTYGVGDKVNTSFVTRRSSVLVTLDIDRADGPQPAIALSGELRFQSSGPDKSVEHEDGTVIPCSKARTLETP